MKRVLIISAIFFLMISSSIILASKVMQEEATEIGKNYKIAGMVKNEQGEVVSNAKVELIDASNRNTQEIQEGQFEYQHLSEGKYQLKVTYDTDQYEIATIRTKKKELYSLGSDYSICFLYPDQSEEIAALVEELANKLKYIGSSNGMKNLKIYEVKYTDQEDIEQASTKIMQDVKSKKLIIAFANHKEFMERCKEKQKSLSVQPYVSVSSPYRILGIYLQGNIDDYKQGLYDTFFIGYQGERNKQELLEKIYEIYENNIIQVSPHRNEMIELNYSEYEGYAQTEEITIETNHDNDTTNAIEIILRQKTSAQTEQEHQANNQNEDPITMNQEDMIIDTQIPDETSGGTKKIDLHAEKHLRAMKLVLADGTTLLEKINPEDTWWSMPGQKVISLDEEMMHGATIYLEYTCKIENKSDSDIRLKDMKLIDCLNYQYNNYFAYHGKEEFLTDQTIYNDFYQWKEESIGDRICLRTTVDQINPGESKEVSLILSKVISTQQDEMYYENNVFIESFSYEYKDDSGIWQEKKVEINSNVTQEKINHDQITGRKKSETIMIIPPTGDKRKR